MADANDVQARVKAALDFLLQQSQNVVRSVNGKEPDEAGNIAVPARNVGDEWHSFTGQVPVGGVPYCGQEVTRETYADLWAWVQAQGLVKTESEWQALSASQRGNVPFYSDGDGSTTFRMPKVVGYIRGAASQAEAGAYTAEGLPNISGSFGGMKNRAAYADEKLNGAFKNHAPNEANRIGALNDTVSVYQTYYAVSFDASRSSSIYGNSTHVTPETSVVLFGVYAFGEITNVGTLDADALATGLATVESRISDCFPLAGGALTGRYIYRPDDDGYLTICGCLNEGKNGAFLTLHGKNFGEDDAGKGQFVLGISNDVGKKLLVGRLNGRLQWDGKEVERINSSGSNWVRYESGLQIVFGSLVGGDGVVVTLPAAFASGAYSVSASYRSTATNASSISIADHSPTSFKVYSLAWGLTWVAVGLWK